MSAKEHHQSLPTGDGDKLTAGVVQKEIHKGMNQADVIAALGSPNIVTRDSLGRETYVWDKISSEYAYSKGSGAAMLLIIGASSGAGAAKTSQSTLTVIVKFAEGVVDEFSYHSSRF
jgi:outer membrane protein assembly factor BamE (lipoprotein component of BamABCDE complex)